MTRFTCENIGFSKTQKLEREAKNAEAAAEACAKAAHSAYWAEKWREGNDSHGNYVEYAIHISATRLHGTVRVYEKYTP